MNDIADMYREDVMDHYENPRNVGEIENASATSKDSNASCGDMVQFQIKTKNGVIEDVKWKGIGCAITTASASKLTEVIKGKSVENVKNMGEDGLLKAIDITVNPGRIKCVTLPVGVVLDLVSEKS